MRKITQEEIAYRVDVSSRTIRNWEKSKPELVNLLRTAISNETYHLDYWAIMGSYESVLMMHEFYVDFYFRFLNQYRKSITEQETITNRSSTNINSALIIYLIQNSQDTLFGSEYSVTDMMLSNLKRDELIGLLTLQCNEKLGKYILKNTLDDFETLIKDSYNVDKYFINAIQTSIMYLIYKYEPDLNFSKKDKIFHQLLSKIGIGEVGDKDKKIKKKFLFNKYIKVKDEFSLQYLSSLDNETCYKNNSFYVPTMFKRMEKINKR